MMNYSRMGLYVPRVKKEKQSMTKTKKKTDWVNLFLFIMLFVVVILFVVAK